MQFKKIATIALVGAAAVLSGCATQVPEYSSTANNVSTLKRLDTKLNVGDITATNPTKSFMCRLDSPVEMPNDATVNDYIESAFANELKAAGIYDQNAQITISGNLNETDVSSSIAGAYWTFDMTVKSSNGNSFNIVHKHEYDASFFAGSACKEDMPESFKPAVQELIHAIIADPRFKDLIS